MEIKQYVDENKSFLMKNQQIKSASIQMNLKLLIKKKIVEII